MNRLNSFKQYLNDNNIDVAVITGKENMYYLSGFSTPGAPRGQALIVTKTTEFIVSRILEVTNSLIPSHGYAEGEDPIQHLADHVLKQFPGKVGLELTSQYMSVKDGSKLISRLGNVTIVDISNVVRGMRSIKTDKELRYMRRAGEIVLHSFRAALKAAESPGATENKVAGAAVKAGYDAGGEYTAYPLFIAFDKNATKGHYAAKRDPIKKNTLLFFEMAGCFERYHAAIMRTIYVGKELPQHLVKAERCVKTALNVMRKALIPGVYPKQVYNVAKMCCEELFEEGWIFAKRGGYSIGIGYPVDWGEPEEICIKEIEDEGDKPIPENATLHLIPWIRHPLYGGIGISDTVIVTKTGAVSLLPKELTDNECIQLINPENPCYEKAVEIERFFGRTNIITPLKKKNIGAIKIFIKDESRRLGQKSFKSLGGAYATARAVSDHITFHNAMYSGIMQNKVFITASDGNHGAGIAWAANMYDATAVIYLPRGIAKSRVERIEKLGATAVVTEVPYDETVELAAQIAKSQGWILVQDTAYEGYTKVPRDIMDAYYLVAHEAVKQMNTQSADPVTHVIVQVGVGSFAAAMTEYMREQLGDAVKIIAIEAREVACLFESMKRGVKTDITEQDGVTMCAGLDCCKLSDLAWSILRDNVNAVATINNAVVKRGFMQDVESGESGAAVGMGFLRCLTAEQKSDLCIDENSRILMFNTEGITNDDMDTNILQGEEPIIEVMIV